ncbi:MAG TPA: YabP/YqfC family sporulation protein [Candidatus Onthoplasma faecigallinarum]|nr:YabP/YqfC family sporulation protein [Candidatus Onthoplasma faecigallinarum]
MENIEKEKKEQLIILSNKQNLSVSGTNKIISLKPELIQLDTVFGGLIVSGEKLELVKLDNSTTRAEINGNINAIKFLQEKDKEPFFRKIFK